MSISFPGESTEYRTARDELLVREIELRRAMEAVAAARRELPPGGAVPEDYAFRGRARAATRATCGSRSCSHRARTRSRSTASCSRAIPATTARGRRPAKRLLRLEEGPCPSCVALLDQLDGAVDHVSQHMNFVGRREGAARARSRPSPRSAAGGGCGCCPRPPTPTTATTSPRRRRGTSGRCSTCSTGKGDTIRHFWGSELFYAPTDPGQDPRHVGAAGAGLEPVRPDPRRAARPTGTSS